MVRPRLMNSRPSPMCWRPTKQSAGPAVGSTAARAEAVCNLYSLNKNKNTVATMFRVPHNRTVHIDPLPGIFPNYAAPVVRHAADGEREMAIMSWGFPLLQAGKAPRRVTNVRDDKILTILIRATPLSGAGHLILRTQRRREAGDVALVCDQRR